MSDPDLMPPSPLDSPHQNTPVLAKKIFQVRIASSVLGNRTHPRLSSPFWL
jgi:hypothetical protein